MLEGGVEPLVASHSMATTLLLVTLLYMRSMPVRMKLNVESSESLNLLHSVCVLNAILPLFFLLCRCA